MAEKSASLTDTQVPINAWLPPVALGWLIPGAGHILLKRKSRGLILMVSVVIMFSLGIAMRGPLFAPQKGDLLTMVIYWGGFLSHAATGLLYVLTVAIGYNQPDMPGQVYDYGTKFLVAAGLLNVLAMVDAYEIATRKKD